jgi:hypothetical protein
MIINDTLKKNAVHVMIIPKAEITDVSQIVNPLNKISLIAFAGTTNGKQLVKNLMIGG